MVEHSYVYMSTLASVIALILLILAFLFVFNQFYLRKRRLSLAQFEHPYKIRTVNEMLKPLGFSYDHQQEILLSLYHPWQRHFRYYRFNDHFEPVFDMVLHCERIYFSYDDREWMLELWKGQYGAKTGAEVGIYLTDEDHEEVHPAVREEDKLNLSFSLFHDGDLLFKRQANYWWLSGFKLGWFANPEALLMHVSVTFPCGPMRDAFTASLEHMGYFKEDIHVQDLTVTFIYSDPRVCQLQPEEPVPVEWIQASNWRICNMYRQLTASYDHTADQLHYIIREYPGFPLD